MSKVLSPRLRVRSENLVVESKHRITLKEMWMTPLMKVQYLDVFILENKVLPVRQKSKSKRSGGCH